MTTQEESSLAEKILTDLECIIYSNELLQEFSIVHTTENEKNKSPILYHGNHLGLELWCVKYVYNYARCYLLRVKPLIQKKTLNYVAKEDLNKLILGALLIKPDVLTFWNMRRELVEKDVIDIKKELLITKLILSSRSKSNETFAYRKWVINRLLKWENINIDIKRDLLNEEFGITEFTANRSPNNYHAWTHRIWSIQYIGLKFLSSFLHTQLDFSLNWILSHVSEHTGFHYRQYLINHVRNYPLDSQYMIKYYKQVYDNLGINECVPLTKYVLNGADVTANTDNYYCVLLNEIICSLRKLNMTYPDHEAIWYHRRFIIHSLLKVSHELMKIPFAHKVNINERVDANQNITSTNVGTSLSEFKFQDNGELHRKLFKGENNAIEDTYLYKFIVKTEGDFIIECSSSKYSAVQNFLAKRHQKWLRVIMCIKDV